MSGLVVLMLLAMSSGGRFSPGLVNMMITQRKETFRKWKVIIDNFQELIVNAYFWFRGPQAFLTPDGKPDTSNTALSGQITQFQKDQLAQSVIGKLLDLICRTVLELLQPGGAEEAMMTAMLNGGLGGFGGGGTGGTAALPAMTTQTQAPAAGRSAADILRGGPQAPRAQGVYISPDGSTYVQ